jgi:hypothetical protein
MSNNDIEICRAWGTLRGCRRGDDCKYRHQGKQGDAARQRVAAKGGVPELCRGWTGENGCRYGDKCPYTHQGQGKLFVEKTAAQKAKEPCRAWKSEKGCRHGDECPYKHEGETGKKAVVQQQRSRNNQNRKQQAPAATAASRQQQKQQTQRQQQQQQPNRETHKLTQLKNKLRTAKQDLQRCSDNLKDLEKKFANGNNRSQQANRELTDQIQKLRNQKNGYAGYVGSLEKQISEENKSLGRKMEANLDDLNWLNNVLVKTGFNKEETEAQARASIKKNVLMNIYDLIDGNFKKNFDNFSDFRADITRRKKFFPLDEAKQDGLLKAFLKNVFGYRRG